MVIVGGQPGHGVLDAVLDVFRMRQYFNVVVRARDVVTAIRRDGAFRARCGARHEKSDHRCAGMS
jgi:hypothetical protein